MMRREKREKREKKKSVFRGLRCLCCHLQLRVHSGSYCHSLMFSSEFIVLKHKIKINFNWSLHIAIIMLGTFKSHKRRDTKVVVKCMLMLSKCEIKSNMLKMVVLKQ